jgi:PAS domain S-box-containing protein/putative nucleotidyltransferase with HDIG domain
MINLPVIDYKILLENMLEGCQIIGPDDTYLYLNRQAFQHARKTKAEIIGKKMGEVYPGIEQTIIYAALEKCRATGEIQIVETDFRFDDGTVGWFQSKYQQVPEGTFITSMEVSHYINAELEIKKLNRMHRVLSDINQTIVREKNIQNVFQTACEIAVNDGNFYRAWIVRYLDDLARAEIIAYAGELGETPLFFTLESKTSPDPGPVSQVAITKEAYVINDLKEVSGQEPWRASLVKLGVHALAAFPLVVRDEYYGCFYLESRDANIFDQPELSLIRELAMDLSFSIEIAQKEKERENALAELVVSEERYRVLVEVSPSAVIVQLNERFAYVNETAVKYFRAQSREDILGRLLIDFVAPKDREKVTDRMHHLNFDRQKAGLTQLTFQRLDGSQFVAESVGAPIRFDGQDGAIYVSHDISARLEVMQALERSEERYRSMVEAAPLGIIVVREEKIVFANREFLALIGASSMKSLHHQDLSSLIHPQDRDRIIQCMRVILESSGHQPPPCRILEARLVRNDGTITFVEVNAVTVGNKDDPVWLIMLSDLTQRMEMDRQLLMQANMLDAIGRAVIAFDPDGYIFFWNRHAEMLYGWTSEEMIGRRISDYPMDMTIRDQLVLAAEKSFSGEIVTVEVAGITRDGQRFPALLSMSPIYDRSSKLMGILTIALDLSEQKHAETYLRQRLIEKEALLALASVVRSASSNNEILLALLEQCLKVVHCNDGSIWIPVREMNGLRQVIARGQHDQLSALILPNDRGAVNRAFITGEVQFTTNDTCMILRTLSKNENGAQKQGVCIPILSPQENIGVVMLSFPQSLNLEAAQTKLLESLGEMAGVGVQNLKLHAETLRHLEQLQSLRAIDLVINSSLDMRHTLNIVLDHVVSRLGVDAASILLFNDGTGTLVYSAGKGFYSRLAEQSSLPLGAGVAGRVALERRMISHPSETDQIEFVRQQLWNTEGFQIYHGVPLVAKGQLKGVLEVFHRRPLQFDNEWVNFFDTLAGQTAIAIDNAQLFSNLQQALLSQSIAYDETIEGWSRALDLRDNETEGHTQRVTALTLKLAERMGLGDRDLLHLRWGALLHDIGKMGIPDEILLKPGPLTAEEWNIMRKHPKYALNLISPIAYLSRSLDIPYCHHEKWDGSGYPRGLSGEAIPLEARIFSVIDVWDALRSDRPYRQSWSVKKTKNYIREESGKSFDPAVVEAFFQMIASEEMDSGSAD